MLSAECAINLREGLEHRVEFFRLNTNPRIAHLYSNATFLVVLGSDVDAPAQFCKLHRVADEIQEHLLSLALIGAEHRQAIRRMHLRAKAALFEAGFGKLRADSAQELRLSPARSFGLRFCLYQCLLRAYALVDISDDTDDLGGSRRGISGCG